MLVFDSGRCPLTMAYAVVFYPYAKALYFAIDRIYFTVSTWLACSIR